MKHSSFFNNCIHTPRVLLALIRSVKKQENFLDIHIKPGLDIAMKNNDGSLDNEDILKVMRYYGLAVPCILGEALCVLRGKAMSYRERMAFTYQGAMTGLFDDFFDKEITSDHAVKQLMNSPDSAPVNNSRQALFLDFYRNALDFSHSPGSTRHYLQKVYEAQIESKQQAIQNKLSPAELHRITVSKGGHSVLFYRSVMENKMEVAEETALYQMGGLMQFGNDIFDIYKDFNQGIDTMITTVDKIQITRSRFIDMMNTSFDSMYQTSYPTGNIRKFLRLISMCLVARCFVFLDQLEKKEKMTGKFTPQAYNRQDLICDMQKLVNKWRTIKYFVKTGIPLR